MNVIKDIYGATVSALITFTLFLGPAIVGLLYSLFPADMVESLVVEDRPPVYFDGAFELSTEEEDGELDGTAELEAEVPVDETPEEPGENGDPDGDTTPDKADTTRESGADVLAKIDPNASARGVSAGSKVGHGKTAKGTGAPGRKLKRSRKKCPRTYDGIKRRPDGVYELRKSMVAHYTGSMKNFNSLGWSRSNAKGKGWVISGFDCQGPMWHGGMRRGDIVLTVNGKRTNNMLQILRLYPKLKAQRRFEVQIIRKGRHITLYYEIVRA